MSEPIILKTPLARIDLAACFAYIGEQNLGAAHRFRQAAEATLTALASLPNTGAPFEVRNPLLTGLRCSRVRRFRNDVIFYRPIDGGLRRFEIVSASHLAMIADGQAVGARTFPGGCRLSLDDSAGTVNGLSRRRAG